jgi:small subunit ribosomal protein S19
MARSVKKGPFVHESLIKRVQAMNSRNEKRVVKTWSRASTVVPDFVGHTLGEFAPTRLFRGHTGNKATDKKASLAPAPAKGGR